MYLHNKIAKEM
jgi:hypothetical protein